MLVYVIIYDQKREETASLNLLESYCIKFMEVIKSTFTVFFSKLLLLQVSNFTAFLG